MTKAKIPPESITAPPKTKRRRRCTGKTKAGKRCQAPPLKGTKRCAAHPLDPASPRFGSPEQAREAGKLGGRPRLPRPHEVLREKIEADVELWLKPYVDALQADRAIVVGEELQFVTDHKLRMQAAREPLDRVYGKPKQQLELGGSETPIQTSIVAADAHDVAEAAHEFLRRIASGPDPGG